MVKRPTEGHIATFSSWPVPPFRQTQRCPRIGSPKVCRFLGAPRVLPGILARMQPAPDAPMSPELSLFNMVCCKVRQGCNVRVGILGVFGRVRHSRLSSLISLDRAFACSRTTGSSSRSQSRRQSAFTFRHRLFLAVYCVVVKLFRTGR